MSCDSVFDSLRLNADVSLSDCRTAVLQKALNKGNVVPVILVNLSGVPLAEAVCADVLIAQKLAYDGKLLLDCSGRDREDPVLFADLVALAVVADVVVDHLRNSEVPFLSGLLFRDCQPVAPAIVDDVARSELNDVADAQTKVAFQNQNCCDPVVRMEQRRTGLHGGDDLVVLLCGQSCCLFVHDVSPFVSVTGLVTGIIPRSNIQLLFSAMTDCP